MQASSTRTRPPHTITLCWAHSGKTGLLLWHPQHAEITMRMHGVFIWLQMRFIWIVCNGLTYSSLECATQAHVLTTSSSTAGCDVNSVRCEYVLLLIPSSAQTFHLRTIRVGMQVILAPCPIHMYSRRGRAAQVWSIGVSFIVRIIYFIKWIFNVQKVPVASTSMVTCLNVRTSRRRRSHDLSELQQHEQEERMNE